MTFYGEQNLNRLTRLGIFKGKTDFWIENGLPLEGLDIDMHGESPTVEIMLKGFTHTISNARQLKLYFSLDGSEDGFDIVDAEGKTTILRFN